MIRLQRTDNEHTSVHDTHWKHLLATKCKPRGQIVDIDWANSFEDGGPKYDLESNHASAYLIPPFVQFEEVDEFIAANFEAIFEEELSSWMEAPETWSEFSLDNFRKWFSVEYLDMVHDLINLERE